MRAVGVEQRVIEDTHASSEGKKSAFHRFQFSVVRYQQVVLWNDFIKVLPHRAYQFIQPKTLVSMKVKCALTRCYKKVERLKHTTQQTLTSYNNFVLISGSEGEKIFSG